MTHALTLTVISYTLHREKLLLFNAKALNILEVFINLQ